MSIDTSAAKCLRHAADLIEHFGWIQGNYGSCSTGFCATGAIGHDAWKRHRNYRNVVGRVYEALGAYVNTPKPGGFVDYVYLSGNPVRAIIFWNDARGQSKEEVVSTMRQVADKLDKGEA